MENSELYTLDGVSMDMSSEQQIAHYHVNMAAFIALGEWFDFMRKNDVYDNTRIILVADHGASLQQFDHMKLDNGLDVQGVNPLFMVKDFNNKEYKTSKEFMTHADTPAIAMGELIDEPKYPVSGHPISMERKNEARPIIDLSGSFGDKNVFEGWGDNCYSVHDDIFKKENWEEFTYLRDND